MDDVDVALALHANPDLERFVPSAVLRTRDEAEHWLTRVAGNHGPGRGWWCVERDGAAVATILLKPIPPSVGISRSDVEIGWRADAAHTGHGYVTEAARVILAAALKGGLDRVVAVTDPENHASQAVARRIGMVPGGRTRDYYDEELEVFIASRERLRRP